MTVTLAQISAARARIGAHVAVSRCARSEALSELTGADVWLKFENLQRTGSFKERGAANFLLLLSEAERARGVITASAGNHAQAVALLSKKLDIRAHVVMPETTPLVKIRATRRFGAEVTLWGRSYDEAAQKAAELAERDGLVYVHPFDDERVIAGQGTLGIELLEQCPELDAVIVPVGGGGLLAGVACAVKQLKPNVSVFGAESSKFPGMQRALHVEAPASLPGGRTIADGIAVRNVGALAIPLVSRYVDDIALVDEAEIAEAVLWLLEEEKTVAEGAGAAALASVLRRRFALEGKRVVVVLSGGNIDVNLLARIIERGLVQTQRLTRFELLIPDVAGSLAQLAELVASTRANILQINHDRAFSGAELGQTRVELLLETFGAAHAEDVLKLLADAGYSPSAEPPLSPRAR